MWASQGVTPFLEISHWLTYGLYAAAILCCVAGIVSLRR
jgi:hypothetical protein